MEEDTPFGITGVIYQEVLQGAATQTDFKRLAEYLGSQSFYEPSYGLLTWQKAAELYFNCRRQGITIRSTIDCLIAQIAIENKMILLHSDLDYIRIAQVNDDLKLYPKNKLECVEYALHEERTPYDRNRN